ncbi:hypothetical protein C8R44DRAFT_742238 [Mycena epipterygia]|nr:hypothetical protein C8R44DRAFT_742238 [Mycena epipterygia]
MTIWRAHVRGGPARTVKPPTASKRTADGPVKTMWRTLDYSGYSVGHEASNAVEYTFSWQELECGLELGVRINVSLLQSLEIRRTLSTVTSVQRDAGYDQRVYLLYSTHQLRAHWKDKNTCLAPAYWAQVPGDTMVEYTHALCTPSSHTSRFPVPASLRVQLVVSETRLRLAPGLRMPPCVWFTTVGCTSESSLTLS